MMLDHNLEDSLGHETDKGLQFPNLSITGQAYDRRQTRVSIDSKRFVVLDRFLSAATRDALLEQYRQYLTPKPIRKTKVEPPDDEPA